jgi:hypothetical protein
MDRPLTMEDIDRVTLDYCLRDEDSAGRALFAAAYGGESILMNMIEECKKRGIDPWKAIAHEARRESSFASRLKSR